jgi:hypothetical protein
MDLVFKVHHTELFRFLIITLMQLFAGCFLYIATALAVCRWTEGRDCNKIISRCFLKGKHTKTSSV